MMYLIPCKYGYDEVESWLDRLLIAYIIAGKLYCIIWSIFPI